MFVMEKRTLIKKWGNAFIINLTSEEMKVNNLKEGDIVNVMVEKVKGK